MKTIIAPVNFSASSNNAARYAADMALAFHAELHLIHFIQFPVTTAEFPINDFVFEEMEKSGMEGLNQLCHELIARTQGKLDIFIHQEVGGMEYRLEEFCKRKAPFLVIMGSPGPSHHLPYPLMVIPEHAVFHQIKRIVLACDLDDIAGGMPVSNSFLKEFQQAFDSSFEVINIATEKQDKQAEAEAAFGFNSWKDQLQACYPEVHFVKMKKVEEGISEYLGQHPADLLLVFPKRHGFLEFHKSHAKKITFHSQVPVMSIHS